MGDLIGARQSGGVEVRHARLPGDADLLQRAREIAMGLIAADPALQRSENQRLRERAVSRYPRAVELFRVGGRVAGRRMGGGMRPCLRTRSARPPRSPAPGSAPQARTECCPACRFGG